MAAVLIYLGRFFIIIVGYAVASVAASVFLNILLLGAINFRPDETLPAVIASMIFSVPLVSLFVAYLAFVPAVPAILIAEVLGKRDWLFYAIAGAIVAAVVIGFMTGTAETGSDMIADPGFALAILASGMCGGIVYWVVCGRSAGRWRDRVERLPISPGPSGS